MTLSATNHVIETLRDAHALSKLVGASAAFMRAIGCIETLARSDAAVVVSGETGTGKELVARALHYGGPRASHPFVAVNCGSLPDSLLEDELFGHERGAFTDARTSRDGLLVQAERGTLFLDEVDSLTPRAQVAILRVLQDKTFRALGSPRERRADVRFVAATNTPLPLLVRRGIFRSDLFYRLCVVIIELPPLRDRRDDVLLLARHFLLKHQRGEYTQRTLAPCAERALLARDWPGNVRELENVILRAQALATNSEITGEDLGLSAFASDSSPHESGDAGAEPLESRSFREAKRAVLHAFELDYLTKLLLRHGGNVSSAARAARTERHDLRRLLKKHRLDRMRFTARGDGDVGEFSPM